jgi:hypothetical protein
MRSLTRVTTRGRCSCITGANGAGKQRQIHGRHRPRRGVALMVRAARPAHALLRPRKSNFPMPHAANSLTAAFARVRFTTDRASGHPAPARAHAATRAERQAPQWARVQRQGRKGPAPRRAAIGKEIINIDRWAPSSRRLVVGMARSGSYASVKRYGGSNLTESEGRGCC